jgi:hypothetical protein
VSSLTLCFVDYIASIHVGFSSHLPLFLSMVETPVSALSFYSLRR